ncbi:MAG: response regulator [Patescibacteria group bacterium]
MPNSKTVLLADTRSYRMEWEALIGYQVGTHSIRFHEAWSVLSAVAATQRECPNLIITELLGAEHGCWMIRELRRIAPDSRIIVVSANNTDRIADAIHAGAVEYFTKPLDYDRFIGTVRRYLEL